MNIFQVLWDFVVNSGLAKLFDIRITAEGIVNGEIIMIAVSCVLIYLAIGKGFEPLLLLPISFGMLLAWRSLNYVIIAALEILLLYYVLRSKAVKNQLDRIKRK